MSQYILPSSFGTFMKECPVGSHLVMNSDPIFNGDIPLMSIGHKYRSQKIVGFISAEEGVIKTRVNF